MNWWRRSRKSKIIKYMIRISKITIVLLLAIVLCISIASSLMAIFGAGWLTNSFSKTLLTISPIFTFIGIIFFVKTIIILKRDLADSRTGIVNTALCYIFLITPFLVTFFHSSIWCIETYIRGIELIPGTCWYN